MTSLSDRYRVAVIGLGRIGATLERDPLREKPASHLGAWMAHEDRCEIVGMCDVKQERIDYARDIAPGRPIFSDYQKMLTEVKADIVSIATSDETHRKIARDAMGYENVKLILLEKPIARTIEEADDIISRAREFKTKIAVNHTRRWHPIWQHAAKLCQEEQPVFMQGTFGGDTIREGVHMADLFNWYGAKQTGIMHPVQGALDYLVFEVDLLWKDKRIRITENGRLSEMYQSFPSKNYNDHIRELEKTCEVRNNLYPTSPMSNVADQLVKCLDEDTSPLCDGEQGRAALKRVLTWS